MIPVVTLPPGDQWDQTLLDDLLAGRLYPHGLEFDRLNDYPANADGIVLVVPGRYFADRTAEISQAIAQYRWVLAFRCGDEEDLLDITAVHHPSIAWWVQTSRAATARSLPLGYTPHTSGLPEAPIAKSLDVFLAGQRTHDRRREAFDAVTKSAGRQLVKATDGFTKGLRPADYLYWMADAKVAPCPAGPASPETFRLYEALQAHAVPIADDITPGYDSHGYWEKIFPGCPFPILRSYSDLPGYIDDALEVWPRNANRIAAWWMAEKRSMAQQLRRDLASLGADTPDSRPQITALVTISPIASHPDTAILEETVASVRDRLPDSEIVLAFDGVRLEQEERRAEYEEHIRRALWLADHQWGNVLPRINDDHVHQAVAAKRALEHVRTPLLLFAEHDTPLCGDIPWQDIAGTILAGDANVVRLSHEASILECHRHLALDADPQSVRGVPLTRTLQWSQRPHFASVAWYRELLDRWFPNDELNYIEDVVYSRLIAAHERDGEMGWLGWRTWIYTPDGDIKRSYHTDGRAGESKFD